MFDGMPRNLCFSSEIGSVCVPLVAGKTNFLIFNVLWRRVFRHEFVN